MQTLIGDVVGFLQKKKRYSSLDKKNFSKFVEIFYLENKPNDFVNYSHDELCDAVIASADFFHTRKRGKLKIRVYNPTLKDHGFESPHTFVDIVNDDMPFLVDSAVLNLEKRGLVINNIIHPTYHVIRDKSGLLQEISNAKGSSKESVMQFHLDKISSQSELKSVEKNIGDILETISLVVDDWKPMLDLAKVAQKQIKNAKAIVKDVGDIAEIEDFISWMTGGNFILLGAKEFNIKQAKKNEYFLEEVQNSSFGIFRSKCADLRPEVVNSSFEEVADSVTNPYIVEILKSRYRSRIHRLANAERIRIQKIQVDEDGAKVIGEFRFIGLFTSSTYHEKADSIPLVRNKISKVIADSGYGKGSHNHKDLVSVLESYPRDELFQISSKDLLKNATGIVAICGRSQVRFFARKDKFSRFVSCLIFMPRDHSNSELREKIKNYLSEIYCGEIADSFVQITDSTLMRFHVIVRTNKKIPEIDESKVEREITNMTRIWGDDLLEMIKQKFGDEKYLPFLTRYKKAFSISYMNRFEPAQAVNDIGFVEECLEKKSVIFNLYESSNPLLKDVTKLKIYSHGKELILSEIMPILESFGFNVIQEQIYLVSINEDEKIRSRQNIWIHHFHLNLSKSGAQFSLEIKKNFEETISSIWNGAARVSLLNRLVVAARLNWRQIYSLRAYTKYLYQTGFHYSQSCVADVLVNHHEVTKLLVELFETKFDPSLKTTFAARQKQVGEISNQIEQRLANLKEITDDNVLRRFFGAINATLRTNYYQSSLDTVSFKGYVSFKFDSQKVPGLPLPIPYAEIFVYSARVEAIHLRGGKVARGGLRWSDRNEDFRTEVLGLMKAQMTKNAVIVPVGSKGGFVLKRDVSGLSRDEIQQEGIECYKTFLRGVLDVTDNVINGEVVHPKDVVMYDAADPYLVVAADKGTATFSDIANSISAEYNFWLGDAFASGGSVGYDHKKMGITAKGAWISVMRHFREVGIDTQKQDFTCIGIGDLAGDVFGNGMLLSKHIKLVAAFNHLHIFFDPNPDAAKSFSERDRMFRLPRSSWVDYDKSLISKGGGVFERSAKSVKISTEVKAVLGIEDNELTPTDLILAILKAPVDLLWNGGIGTYVKASEESNQEVGDRANDVLRINGSELRCKVVGEGGNLGFTQKGRIEYALKGGRINTDAMDNSAGVDCSDHEVNIKIALTSALRSKKITLEERNKVLESMTDEVSELVLSDNRLQTQAISVANFQGISLIGDQSQFLDKLEKSGLLNRKIEFLPSKQELNKRQNEKIGLTKPELCVMLAYSKMDIYNSLLTSDLLKDKYFEHDLLSYFPKVMQQKFGDEVLNHQLRNEIIATQITNFVVNRMGITFVTQICQDNGFGLIEVVKNLIIACDSFRLREIWEKIENLNDSVALHIQMQMFLSVNKLLERSVTWLLRNQSKENLETTIVRFRKIADELSSILSQVLATASRESFERKIESYRLNNVDEKLAEKVAALDLIASTFDIAEISNASNFDIKIIAKIYFVIGARFSLQWLRNKASEIIFDNYWQKLSGKAVLEDTYSYQMRIAKSVVNFSCNDQTLCEVESLNKWIKHNNFLVERFDNFISELKTGSNYDLSVFIVALNRIKSLG